MIVKLVSYSPSGERVVAIASKISRSRKGWDEHNLGMNEEEMEVWIRDAILHGYWSVLEHSVYTFSIEGISRVTSHQIVRHRVASFTQTSHRFAKPVDEYYDPVIPPSVEKRNPEMARKGYQEAYDIYHSLLSQGVPEEDARYFLPNGVNTNLVVTMNARELYNFFALRTCSRAQWEIRQIAWRMLEEVRRVHPRLFRYAGPSCIIHENFVRREPITVDHIPPFLVSERCIEGVQRDGIRRCAENARKRL